VASGPSARPLFCRQFFKMRIFQTSFCFSFISPPLSRIVCSPRPSKHSLTFKRYFRPVCFSASPPPPCPPPSSQGPPNRRAPWSSSAPVALQTTFSLSFPLKRHHVARLFFLARPRFVIPTSVVAPPFLPYSFVRFPKAFPRNMSCSFVLAGPPRI